MCSFQKNKIEKHFIKVKGLSLDNTLRMEYAADYLKNIQVKKAKGFVYEQYSSKITPLPFTEYDVFKTSDINSGIWYPIEQNQQQEIPEKAIACEVLIVETSHQIFIVDWLNHHGLSNPENAFLFIARDL